VIAITPLSAPRPCGSTRNLLAIRVVVRSALKKHRGYNGLLGIPTFFKAKLAFMHHWLPLMQLRVPGHQNAYRRTCRHRGDG